METLRSAVLGAGSWGTALAKLLADQGHPTTLWARRKEQAQAIDADRENRTYLPGFKLPDCLSATSDLKQALDGSQLIVVVVPTHGLRKVLDDATPLFPEGTPLVSATKGIENDTLELVSEMFEDHLPESRHGQLAYLGGPSFAKEVAAGIPTAVSIAAHLPRTRERTQAAFSTDRFRVYTTEDVIGVELGGALKNVIAIASGIADGFGFGHNTKAALITRGLAEITRLATDMGANPMTLSGLSGMGDLVLTCNGDLSRNRFVGVELGKGKKLADILGEMTMVAEGVRTTKSARNLAKKRGVEMPIVESVYSVLYEDKSPAEAVVSLMARPPRAERG